MVSRVRARGRQLGVIVLLGALAYLLGLSFFAYSWSAGPNYKNVTVDSKVNITGSSPRIYYVRLPGPVTLSAGSLTTVQCNASIRDYNGYDDISNVNGTFFHSTSSEYALDDNNTHYSNATCNRSAGDGFYSNYTCSFLVNYYALNGTWNCSVRVNDSKNLKHTLSNTTSVNALYALNITPTLIDFGNVSAEEYSANVTANVSNIGNLPINISVFGYARNLGDNLAFVCDQGNLTIDLVHFAANDTASYYEKQNLTSSFQAVGGLTVAKTTNASYSLNTTWWELYADPLQIAFGNCTGFIVFQAGTS